MNSALSFSRLTLTSSQQTRCVSITAFALGDTNKRASRALSFVQISPSTLKSPRELSSSRSSRLYADKTLEQNSKVVLRSMNTKASSCAATCCGILLVLLANLAHSFTTPLLSNRQSSISSELSLTNRLHHNRQFSSCTSTTLPALSDDYLENDLVAVKVPERLLADKESSSCTTRFCVVRPDATVAPLCRHEDDVDTDLFVDPRTMGDAFWSQVSDEDISQHYGEGWYGQRPVPSLGGGPG